MDNSKSYEFTFLYLVNKCILLFKYIDIKYQKATYFIDFMGYLFSSCYE